MYEQYRSIYTDKEINDNLAKFFTSLNTVEVTAPTGSTVKMTHVEDGNTIEIYGMEDNGKWIFYPTYFGSWTILATRGQSSASRTIDLNSIEIQQVSLSFS